MLIPDTLKKQSYFVLKITKLIMCEKDIYAFNHIFKCCKHSICGYDSREATGFKRLFKQK